MSSPSTTPTVVAAATQEDPHVTELVTKVGRLVDSRFGGDARAAFDHYAGADGKVSADELSKLLKDAGIGNMFTRGSWVSGIMEQMDRNRDGQIGRTEFNSKSPAAAARA